MRFPCYKSKWKKNYFKDELDILKNNTLSRAELNYKSGKIKNIHYGDILVKFKNSIYSNSKQIPYINEENIPKNHKSMLLKSGDLIIADTAEDYTVGKSVEIINNDETMIISGLHTIPCRPKQSQFALKYLGYYTNSPSFHNQLLPIIQGIKVSSISKSQIKETYISYPEIKEQEKIVKFLELISSRINTQSKIIEDLETLKNSIWNHIYTRESINWDQIKLKNILTERKTYCIKDSKYPHATLSKEGVGLKTDRYNRDFLVKDDEKNYKVTHLNDICYNPANLKFGVICRNKLGSAIFSPIYITYEVSPKINASFIECILTSNSFINYIRKYEQGTVYERMAVNSDDFLKGIIKVPSLEEQSKIVNLMNSFEQKIKKEKDMLELYKKQKAYLLQNMFI